MKLYGIIQFIIDIVRGELDMSHTLKRKILRLKFRRRKLYINQLRNFKRMIAFFIRATEV